MNYLLKSVIAGITCFLVVSTETSCHANSSQPAENDRLTCVADTEITEIEPAYGQNPETIELPENIEMRVDTILNLISQDSVVYLTEGVGFGGEPTTQYMLANHLKDIVSPKRLQKIALSHPSAVVRAAVFNALIRKDPHAATEVAIQGIEDMTIVVTMSGCCVTDDTLSILRVNQILINSDYYHVSEADLEQLCEVVLFSKDVERLDAYGDLYEVLTPKAEYYERLNQLFDKESYTAPLLALVKYGKKEDKALVLELLKSADNRHVQNDALRAVRMQPDRCYEPYLRAMGSRYLKGKANFSRFFYAALMTIEEPWVEQMIDSSISGIRNEHKQMNNQWELYSAYQEHPVPFFKKVYDKHCKRYDH